MPYKDKEKAKEARRKHYLENKSDYLKRAKEQGKPSSEAVSRHNRTYYEKNRDELLLKMKGRDRKSKNKPAQTTIIPEKEATPKISTEITDAIKHNREKLLKKSLKIQYNINQLLGRV